MPSPTKLFIVDDSRLFRDGLRAILSRIGDYDIVGEAGDGIDAIRCIRKLAPDLVLLDLSMPRVDGFSVLREIRGILPNTKILVLSMHESAEHIQSSLECGADGYLLKDSSIDEFKGAIAAVLDGKQYLHPQAVDLIRKHRLEKKHSGPAALTPREREVIKMIGEGYQNKEIAAMLNVAVKTVEKHRANIMDKLDLHNASGLTAYACQRGYVTPKGGGPLKGA